MFWADNVVGDIRNDLADKINSGKTIIIRDEKTLSGRVHIGSMRGVAIHGVISEILKEQNIDAKFLYEINDFDPMDGIPSNLDQEEYKKYLGKPLYAVPSPDDKEKNFPEFYAKEFIGVIEHSGFSPQFYRSSDMYKSGRYNEVIDIALKNASDIRRIYFEVSGSQKPDDWMPLNVICENCGKVSTTKVTAYDGKEVEYECLENLVEWTEGCNHKGKVSPFDGNSKLPWKVEWAAKFKVFDVDVEGGGKDHSTRGGSRDVANHLAKEVFKHIPPFDIPYEFLLVQGKKMSSSKGAGSSSKEVGDLLPTKIFRLFLIGKNPKRTLDFIPDGDTIPVLFDWYDKLSQAYFDKTNEVEARLFELSNPGGVNGIENQSYLPKFSQIAFLIQMPHMDIYEECQKVKGDSLSEADKREIDLRVSYARKWLDDYAPEDYRFDLAIEQIPEAAKNLSDKQKDALSRILEYIESVEILDGQELHTKIHDIKKDSDIEPKELFGAIYQSFLGKESGPKVGWFLSVLERPFLIERLKEVTK